MNEIYDFLVDLKANNNKEWFNDNRKRYEKTREQFLSFTEILINEIKQFDPHIATLNPKECMFRIFRDVRFSKDKTPYKSNYGSYIARNGRKSGYPGYYVHIEPGTVFVGGGIYGVPPEHLKIIRNDIVSDPDTLLEILNDENFSSYFEMYSNDSLKTAPKGFSKDFEQIELLRYRSFSPFRNYKVEDLFKPDFLENVIDDFRKMYPLNQYLNYALDNV